MTVTAAHVEDPLYIEDVIARLKRRDATAFTFIYGRYHHWLLHHAQSKVGNHEVAEDIVADAFVVLWENGHRLRATNEASLKAWLKKLVFTKAVDEYKRRASAIGGAVSLDDESLGELVDPTPRAEEQLVLAIQAKEVAEYRSTQYSLLETKLDVAAGAAFKTLRGKSRFAVKAFFTRAADEGWKDMRECRAWLADHLSNTWNEDKEDAATCTGEANNPKRTTRNGAAMILERFFTKVETLSDVDLDELVENNEHRAGARPIFRCLAEKFASE